MAVTAIATYDEPPRGPRRRLFEDERWLAFALLVPTMVLLGLFIAYPFVRGIELSVTNSRVGVPGEFIGLANFYKIWNDSIFRVAVWASGGVAWIDDATSVHVAGRARGVAGIPPPARARL